MSETEEPQISGPPVVTRTLIQDIEKILNRHNVENSSNTPDFILAQFLLRVLLAGEELVNERHKWWGLPDPWARALSEFMPEDPADTPEDAERLAILRKRINEIVYTTPDRDTNQVVIPHEDVTDPELLAMLGTDAQRWAWEFGRVAAGVPDMLDQGWLIAWFANAIQAGWDAGYRAHKQAMEAEQAESPRPSPTTNADLD